MTRDKIWFQISQPPIGDHERHMQHCIRERMKGMPEPSSIKSRGALLLELARELRELREVKEELEARRSGKLSAHLSNNILSNSSISYKL